MENNWILKNWWSVISENGKNASTPTRTEILQLTPLIALPLSYWGLGPTHEPEDILTISLQLRILCYWRSVSQIETSEGFWRPSLDSERFSKRVSVPKKAFANEKSRGSDTWNSSCSAHRHRTNFLQLKKRARPKPSPPHTGKTVFWQMKKIGHGP